MAITDEHRKSADKSMYGIFGLKGLTPKEKNQLFAEAMARRNAESKTGSSKYKPEQMSKEAKMQKAKYGTSFAEHAKRQSIKESAASGRKQPTWTEGTEARHENIDTKTEEQIAQTKEILELLKGKWKPLLEDMAKSPRTAMNQQIEDMFGHMNNPIVQSMMNQGYRTNPQVLFPSELGQHDSSRQLDALLSGLGQQYGPDIMNYGYDKASQYLPQAYESAMQLPGQIGQYGKQMGGGLMDILSNLGNRFRSPQQ